MYALVKLVSKLKERVLEGCPSRVVLFSKVEVQNVVFRLIVQIE